MSQEQGKNKQAFRDEGEDQEEETTEYNEMELLEMLESLREDMEELGVTSLDELIVRIEELHQRLDAR